MLIGREREQQRLAALLDEARRGRSGTLVVAGDPGLGKTALAQEAIRLGADMRVLAATGVESESELPFASLHELLRPLLDLLSKLPAGQASSLAAALALEQGEPDPLSVRAATLSLLVEASESAPLLVVVDDVQWIDRSSAEAVAFAARRLRAEGIALVAAVRSGVPTPFDTLPRLELAPLQDADARRLLRERPDRVAPADELRLLAAAGGNPLALLELPVELATELPRSATTIERLRRAFLPRVHDMPEAGRLGLLLAAAEPDTGAVWRAAEALGVLDPLTEVEETGLARIDGQHVVFRHPVVRSLVYVDARDGERRTAHRALADALTGESDADRRAWHLAAAAQAPNDEVAALLEATAERAAVRGGRAAQASALERAARLSGDPDEAAQRLAAAARAAANAGQLDRAAALAEEAIACARDPVVRARAVVEHTVWTGRTDPAAYDQERFLAAIGRIEELDPDHARRALEMVVNRRNEALDLAGARELLPLLERIARRAEPARRRQSLSLAADVYLASGERETFTRLYAEFRDDPRTVATDAIDLIWAEEYVTVRHALEVEAQAARSAGELLRVLWLDACLAHLELRLGRLREATLAASRALTLAEAFGVARFRCVASCALAQVYAWQADTDRCRQTAADALAVAGDANLVSFEFLAASSLGLLALSEGRTAEAIAVLEPQAERWAATELVEPSIVPFVPDLVEAHALGGDTAQSARWLARFAEAAQRADRNWALAACARCEGLLASADAFDEPFVRALDIHERSPTALERARAQLAYGERLRRSRRLLEARTQLQRAHETFAAAGATPWETRAATELRAAGVDVGPAAQRNTDLTPQELSIATLVADGKTNKEIAAAMYLSPKTIEYHLANAYRKLDIHSRAELARLVTRDAL